MFLPNKHSFRLRKKSSVAKNVEEAVPEMGSVLEVETVEEVDAGKRGFLRIAGLLGLGIVATTVLPKKAEAYVLGGAPTSPVVGSKDASNNRINPAKEDGNLALIQGQTAKLTFDGSNNLYVQAATGFSSQLENASSTVINPATEESLTTVKNQLNKLTFDGSNNLLTASSGGTASVVALKDTTGTQINPATDDAVVYLRRIVKLMESQAVVDSGNRQRITLDSLGTATAITTTVPVSGTVTATVASTTITSISAGTNVIGGVTIDGQGRQMFTETARQAYNSGIRGNLVFS